MFNTEYIKSYCSNTHGKLYYCHCILISTNPGYLHVVLFEVCLAEANMESFSFVSIRKNDVDCITS